MINILVVDDQQDIRRLLSVALGGRFQVFEAQDGIEALQMISLHHPRVVLLDIMMPGEIDGIGVLDAIRNDTRYADILVAMITAKGQQMDVNMGEQHGADAYFVKPFSPLQIIQWVEYKLR